MKIEFERYYGTYICHFNHGGKKVVVEDVYVPEKFVSIEDFFGNLATRALEQAVEQENREAEEKIFEKIKKGIEGAAKDCIHKLDPLPIKVADYGKWPEVSWPKQNPYIVSDFTPKSKRIQPKIEKVIFSYPATIVFWSDGDKTVVKATNERFDREKGLAMAIAKKFLGNKGNYYDVIKKYTKGLVK